MREYIVHADFYFNRKYARVPHRSDASQNDHKSNGYQPVYVATDAVDAQCALMRIGKYWHMAIPGNRSISSCSKSMTS